MGAIDALKRRDTAAAVKIVESDARAIEERENGISLLLLAVYHHASDVVAALLARGAKPDVFEAAALGDVSRLRAFALADPKLLAARNVDGPTALHLAAHFGHRDAVALLLGLGADVRAMAGAPFSNTPLHAAAAGGRAEVVETLLAAGADANARDGNGYAPLHVAAANGDESSAKALLARGADANGAGPGGKTPLAVALERGKEGVAALLRASGGR